MECIDDRSDRRYSLTLCQLARSRFNEIDTVTEAVSFIAPEEKHLILHDRAADGTAELVHPKREFVDAIRPDAVEEIAGVHRVIAQKFEQGAMDRVASRLRYDADLPTASRSK